jgi:trans-aconitate methyltransferase
MKPYHQYVFDDDKRAFVGRFEEMYRAERECGFDSWHQDDLRTLTRQVALAVLDQYAFDRILDLGCGKGVVTQFLKKRNNRVVAVDISGTALETARARYPDIDFVQADIGAQDFDLRNLGEDFALAVCLESLSYLERWPALLEQLSHVSRRALVALYLPENPLGFVKSFDELARTFGKHFVIVEEVRLLTRRQIVLFGESNVRLQGEKA